MGVAVKVGLLVTVGVYVLVGEAVCDGARVRVGDFVAGAWATGELARNGASLTRGTHAANNTNMIGHQ